MKVFRRRLTKQDKESFRQALNKMAGKYGRDVVLDAVARSSGNPVYIYCDESGEIIGFESFDKNTNQLLASAGVTVQAQPKGRDGQQTQPLQPSIPAVPKARVEGGSDASQNSRRDVSFKMPPERGWRKKQPGHAASGAAQKSSGGSMGIVVKVVAALVVIGALVGGGIFAWGALSRAHDTINENTVVIDDDDPNYDEFVQAPDETVAHIAVVPGDNIISVRQKMLDAGLVSIARDFAPAMREEGGTDALKAADYVVAASESASSVAARMASGTRVPSGVIGINPGDDIYDIAASIDNAGLPFSGADFLAETQKVAIYRQNYPMLSALPDNVPTLEGYFPEGEYNLAVAPNVAEATHAMLRQADKNFEASGLDSAAYYIALTKASMIEKEALFNEDRPLIASVIENRLAQGMELQIDATVKYATGSDESRVMFDDIEVDSPYNTYQHVGLPIGPICSGISPESYQAAVQPAQTDFLYYVLKDKEGHHAFSSTLEQFEQDRNHYLEIFGYEDNW